MEKGTAFSLVMSSCSDTLQVVFSYPSTSEDLLSCVKRQGDHHVPALFSSDCVSIPCVLLRTEFARRSACMLFPASRRCEPSRIICMTQVSGYPGNRTYMGELYAGCPRISLFHVSDPVICEMPMTPESERCELYEVLVFTRE